MQILPSTVLLLSQKIKVGVFFERNWTQFSVSYKLSFAAIDLKCEPLKEIKESRCIYPCLIIRYHCDSFTSEARMIAAKACSAAWFNTHAIIGAS